MAASICDGAFVFWHQGLPVLALGKTGAVVGSDYTYWHQGMSALRNLGAGAATVPTLPLVSMEMPVPHRSVVAY
jgi:hypothetical protein